MAAGTAIEWTHIPGFKPATWNPIVGCSIVSKGCTNCYAMKTAGARTSHTAKYAGLTQRSKAGPVWTGEVRFWEKALLDPLRWREPHAVFVNSMGDLFHEDVPDAWIDQCFAAMALCPQHIFMVLTKRAERMRTYVTKSQHEFFTREGMIRSQADFILAKAGRIKERLTYSCALPLPNVWLGVSAEDQEAYEERNEHLRLTPAAVTFFSIEPMLGPIKFRPCRQCNHEGDHIEWPCPACRGRRFEIADWVIVGGESQKGARPMHPEWAREIRDQCVAAGVPFFFKQWGEWFPFAETDLEWFAARKASGALAKRTDLSEASGWPMQRCGKKAAGRILDGRTWDEFPARRREAEGAQP